MKFKIIALGGFCFVVVFGVAVLVATYLGDVIGDQSERNYDRFVQNVEGLTNTFRPSVEECAIKAVKEQDEECMILVDEEYRIQFGSLIKLFGYEEHIQELYQYWQADLQYWYDVKKIELENVEIPDVAESEIKRISEIRDQAVQARLQPEFAILVDSKE
jgi:hypothetical protein